MRVQGHRLRREDYQKVMLRSRIACPSPNRVHSAESYNDSISSKHRNYTFNIYDYDEERTWVLMHMKVSDKRDTISTDSKQVYKARFIEIFKRLSRDEFMEDPARILSFMMDFGFERRQVGLLKLVLAQDMKGFKGFFECSPGSEDDAIDAIADYCLVSRDALSEVMHSMKDALSTDDIPTIIGEHRGEKCLVSDDGIAKYSLDLKTILEVDDTTSFCISDYVTAVGVKAFSDCSSLKEIIIPDSVTSIGDSAFSYCYSLKEIVLPDSVTSIGDRAFFRCKSLKEVIIPDSVSKIGDSAFYRCTSLAEVVIPESVTTIGDRAFSRCFSLKEIALPDSVSKIGDSAFFDCSSLKVIEVPRSLKCEFKGIGSDVMIIRR